MTTSRPEIIVEGSDDGLAWTIYRFRWKPGATDERPRLAFLHLPRLDWQMWFAALAGDCRRVPWFFRFEQSLLEGSPAVLGLLAENPFPARPPHYVRARLYLYKFTQGGSPDWWAREDMGLFCPPVSLEYFK
jgi:lipase maturation factor 1